MPENLPAALATPGGDAAAPPAIPEEQRQMSFTMPRFELGNAETVPHRTGDNLTDAGKAGMSQHGLAPLKTSAMRQAGQAPLEITLRYGSPSASLMGAAKAPKRVFAIVTNPPYSVHELQLEDHAGNPRLRLLAETGLTEAYWHFKKKKEGFRVPVGTPVSALQLDPMQEELLQRNGFGTLNSIKECNPEILEELVGPSDAYYLIEAAKKLLDSTPAPEPAQEMEGSMLEVMRSMQAQIAELTAKVAAYEGGDAPEAAAAAEPANTPSLEELASAPTEAAPRRRTPATRKKAARQR